MRDVAAVTLVQLKSQRIVKWPVARLTFESAWRRLRAVIQHVLVVFVLTEEDDAVAAGQGALATSLRRVSDHFGACHEIFVEGKKWIQRKRRDRSRRATRSGPLRWECKEAVCWRLRVSRMILRL